MVRLLILLNLQGIQCQEGCQGNLEVGLWLNHQRIPGSQVCYVRQQHRFKEKRKHWCRGVSLNGQKQMSRSKGQRMSLHQRKASHVILQDKFHRLIHKLPHQLLYLEVCIKMCRVDYLSLHSHPNKKREIRALGNN